MDDKYAELSGDSVKPPQLRLQRSQSFVRAVLESGLDTIRECRVFEADGTRVETVAVDIQVARPQKKTDHEIRLSERIAARFASEDRWPPEVLALRESFPDVPHLNIRLPDQPRSLCLYADDWNDQRLRWNGKAFLERIRDWLGLTARGKLHQDDQPLEPFMFNSGYRIVVSHRIEKAGEDAPVPLTVISFGSELHEQVLIACDPAQEKASRPEQKFLMFRITTPAVSHGVIHSLPRTMADLAALTDRAGFSLLDALREKLRTLPNNGLRERRFVLLLDFPKTRTVGGRVESVERKAFLSFTPVSSVGEKLGVWEKVDGMPGMLLGNPSGKDGTEVVVDAVMDVSATCSWDTLAILNGEASRTKIRIFAVGAGALGSQIACNLARSGFGEWTIVDTDALLPHNMARHTATATFTGWSKAVVVSGEMNALADDDPIAEPLHADILRPGEKQPIIEEKVSNADVILDMSASVAVARKLRDNVPGKRVISTFLNPSGHDLVVLAEDAERKCPLDHLEMRYYWAAATLEELQNHLGSSLSPHVRYGTSCRDVSSRVSQDFVAFHAANGARVIRKTMNASTAGITVFQYDDESYTLNAVPVPVEVMCSCKLDEWHVYVSPDVLRSMMAVRKESLPKETGGVLVGGIDFDRFAIYIVGLIPAPADSRQFPNGFIRGSKLLAERLREIERRTLGNLSYLGEWHSHPNGTGTMPSTDDAKLFTWIQENTVLDGRPAVMVIAGQRGEFRVAVKSISLHKTVRCPKQ